MSRRRSWPRRHPKTVAVAALVTAGVVHRWPQQSLAAAITTVAAVAAAAWAYTIWRNRHPELAGDQRPTGLYRHYFTNGAALYGGITNNYPARWAQHLAGSWWTAYADPARSTWQVWTAADCPPGRTPRQMAKAAESEFIFEYAPIGNVDENPLWFEQEPYRRQLKAAIGWTDPPRQAAHPARRRMLWRAA